MTESMKLLINILLQ